MHRRVVVAGLVEVDLELPERIIQLGNHHFQFNLLRFGDLLHDQDAGAVRTEPPKALERVGQLVDGGVDQVI